MPVPLPASTPILTLTSSSTPHTTNGQTPVHCHPHSTQPEKMHPDMQEFFRGKMQPETDNRMKTAIRMNGAYVPSTLKEEKSGPSSGLRSMHIIQPDTQLFPTPSAL